MERKNGKLYLVATPLGNLEDITQRALRILNEVDLIAAEDTRHTLKLLTHFGIRKQMLSYFQHNERERSTEIVDRLLQGESVALVTDAGMPGISDPGNVVVTEAIKQGITIIPIPGASAVITGLAASGLATESFLFAGFLPRKVTEQMAVLEKMKDFDGTLAFYESPQRIKKTLTNILTVLGDRNAVIARELTKLHEEFIRGKLSEILQNIADKELKGEITLMVEGSAISVKNYQNSTRIDMDGLFSQMGNTQSLKAELKEIARMTGRSVKDVYQMYLKQKK